MAFDPSTLATASPFGAAAAAGTAIATQPDHLQSGDVTTGAKTFGGITKGFVVPNWAWGVAIAFAGLLLLAHMRKR